MPCGNGVLGAVYILGRRQLLLMAERIVFHVDMDQFFAACEVREKPELAGKPVVVGADPKAGKGRGVVSTSSYEARKFGVKSGMPISQAYRLCPKCIFLPVNFDLYLKCSAEVMEVLHGFAVKFEVFGIDEAFLEVTGKAKDFREAERLAREVKKAVKEKTGLACTVGVGPNKIVAKVASDFKKPDGLTVVKTEDARAFLAPMQVRKLPWIGEKTEEALRAMGIGLVGELAEADPVVLFENFGRAGPAMRLTAQGIDESPLIEMWEAKSIGNQRTFERDTSDEREIFEKLDELCNEVYQRADENGVSFSNIGIVIRFTGFETHTKAKTMRKPCTGLDELKAVVRELVLPFLEEGRPVRLVGVRLAGLKKEKGQKKLGEF